MSQPNRTNIPTQRTSTDDQPRHTVTRAELRQRNDLRDLRDALNEARALVRFERVMASA